MMLTHRQCCRWFVDRSPCGCEAQARHELGLPGEGRLRTAEQERVNAHWRAEYRQSTSTAAITQQVAPAAGNANTTSQPTRSSVTGVNMKTAKIEKHRAKLGAAYAMASVEEVQAAWKVRKQMKRDAAAASQEATLVQLAQSVGLSVERTKELMSVTHAGQLPKAKS